MNGVISKPQLVGYKYVGYQGVIDIGAPGVSPSKADETWIFNHSNGKPTFYDLALVDF